VAIRVRVAWQNHPQVGPNGDFSQHGAPVRGANRTKRAHRALDESGRDEYTRPMASELNIPIPNEFDEQPYDDQVRYIEALLRRMEAKLDGELDPHLVELVKRRYDRFLEDADEGEPIEQVRAELLTKYQ
jgi:hypothetical protein